MYLDMSLPRLVPFFSVYNHYVFLWSFSTLWSNLSTLVINTILMKHKKLFLRQCLMLLFLLVLQVYLFVFFSNLPTPLFCTRTSEVACIPFLSSFFSLGWGAFLQQRGEGVSRAVVFKSFFPSFFLYLRLFP